MALGFVPRQITAVRSVFFGTPAIALPTLEALLENTELVATVCQPDRLGGRGMRPMTPAVKAWAESKGILVFQPDKLKDGVLTQWLSENAIDVAVVLAYGKILPQQLLDAPRLGCVNLHASLLPYHRGAAPIQWSIISGDADTGVTLMKMDAGLDTGPMLSQHKIAIAPRETTGSLIERIAELCAKVVREDLPRYARGELSEVPQDNQGATWAPPIRASDRRITFDDSAQHIDARIRALAPAPGAITVCRGKVLRLLESTPLAHNSVGVPGTVTITPEKRIVVSTRAGSLELIRAQLEGKKPLSAKDLINGRSIAQDDILGD